MDNSEPYDLQPTSQFRIVHIFYIIALLGSALAVFGKSGVFPGIFVCFF